MSRNVIIFLIICWVGVALLLSLVTSGCGGNYKKPTQFQLSNGRYIQCQSKFETECGTTFSDCTDGIIYRCQNNYGELN